MESYMNILMNKFVVYIIMDLRLSETLKKDELWSVPLHLGKREKSPRQCATLVGASCCRCKEKVCQTELRKNRGTGWHMMALRYSVNPELRNGEKRAGYWR